MFIHRPRHESYPLPPPPAKNYNYSIFVLFRSKNLRKFMRIANCVWQMHRIDQTDKYEIFSLACAQNVFWQHNYKRGLFGGVSE